MLVIQGVEVRVTLIVVLCGHRGKAIMGCVVAKGKARKTVWGGNDGGLLVGVIIGVMTLGS